MGNVTYDGSLDTTDLKHIEIEDDEREKAAVHHGDILFNRTNSKELVGKTGLWDGRFEAVAASYFIRLRVDRRICHPAYLWAFMNTGFMKRTLAWCYRAGQHQCEGAQSLPRGKAAPRPSIRLC
jgi:type I restriction enzyme S subunit